MKRKTEYVPFGGWENYAQFLIQERRKETALKESYFSYIVHKGLHSDYMEYVEKRKKASSASIRRVRSALRVLLHDIQELNDHV